MRTGVRIETQVKEIQHPDDGDLATSVVSFKTGTGIEK